MNIKDRKKDTCKRELVSVVWDAYDLTKLTSYPHGI